MADNAPSGPGRTSMEGPGSAPLAPDPAKRHRLSTAEQVHLVGHQVWTAGRLLLLAGGLALTFGVFFLTSFAVATRARSVRVPDVRGKTIAEATAALSTVGLGVAVDPVRRADAKVPADHVLSQEPDPGDTLRRQRPVRVHISDGQRDPIVPSVVGQPDQAATAILAQAGITIGERINVTDADSAAGTVVAQDPPSKDRSRTVTLLINQARADQTFVMPDLIGTMGDRAAEVLRSHNLRVAPPTVVAYAGLPPGVVVRQTPQAGYQTAPDELIVLEVSK